MPPIRPAPALRPSGPRRGAGSVPSPTRWPIPGSGSEPEQGSFWSRPSPCAAIASAGARPRCSGRSTACPAGCTRPPGSSCSSAPSAPPPPRPARHGWPGTANSPGGLLAGGAGTWALSKVFKQVVRRPRPAALLPGTRVRGREAAGLGYLSGHAGVAVALGTAAFPRLGKTGRAVTLSVAPVVGLTRIYAGAHLPLDVAGGVALGLVVEAALALGRRPAAACGAGRAFRPPRCRPSALGRAAGGVRLAVKERTGLPSPMRDPRRPGPQRQ